MCTRLMMEWVRFEQYIPDASVWFTYYDEVIKEELMQQLLGISKDLVDDDRPACDRMIELLRFVRAQRTCTKENIEAIRAKCKELRAA